MKRGKRLVLLTSLLFLLFLLLLLVLPLTTASNQNKTTPATIIPAPLGSIQITDNKITTSAIIDDTQFLIDLQTGQIIHTKKLSPSGLVLTEDGVEGAGVPYDGYEKDEAIYITKDGRAIDPHANVFLSTYLPTLGSELGNSLWGAAKSIGTLGIYNAYQSYKYNFANPPATWGEVGLRTIDQTPVAGSVKAAIESDNWVDATSNGLNALGSGILIGTGLTAKFAPNTYARLSQIKIPPQNVFYVDPYGVAIASKWGVPSERAFVGAPLTVIQQRGLSKALDPIIDLIFETIKKMGVKIRRLPPIYKEEDIIASVNKFLMEEYTKQGRISPAVHATSKEALQGIMRDKGFNQQMFMSYPGQGMLPFGKGAAIIVKPEYIGKPVTILDSHLLGLPPGSGHVAFILGKGEIPTKYLLYFDPSQNKFVPFPE